MDEPRTTDGPGANSSEPGGHGFTFEPHPTRVRVEFDGVTVADSEEVCLLRETHHAPVFYFPRDAVDWRSLRRTGHRTFCPIKGHASYWSLETSGRHAENAAWSYVDPIEEAAHIKGYVAFYANLVDIIEEAGTAISSSEK